MDACPSDINEPSIIIPDDGEVMEVKHIASIVISNRSVEQSAAAAADATAGLQHGLDQAYARKKQVDKIKRFIENQRRRSDGGSKRKYAGFGETLPPEVKVSKKRRKKVNNKDGPPVMFKDCKEGEETGKELVVWAWSTQPGMCAEGVTWIVQSRTENSDLVTRRDFDVRDIINMNQKVVYSEKDSDISFGSISECSEIDRNKSLNSNLSTLLNFTPFKRYNFSGNREDLESSFQWEDVEKKFQQVLLANDLNDDFDELVNEYEDFYSVSQDACQDANVLRFLFKIIYVQ